MLLDYHKKQTWELSVYYKESKRYIKSGVDNKRLETCEKNKYI